MFKEVEERCLLSTDISHNRTTSKIQELKNIMPKIKNTLHGINNRIDT